MIADLQTEVDNIAEKLEFARRERDQLQKSAFERATSFAQPPATSAPLHHMNPPPPSLSSFNTRQ